MASNFKPWVDSPTAGQQVQSAQVFATDAQRVNGFIAGNPASALRVNSALRQANIVVAGLMQMCDDIKTLPDGLSLMSTVTQVKNAIKAAIDQLDATVLTSAKSYTDTREGVINGKITNIQNQVIAAQADITQLEGYYEVDLTTSSWSGSSGNYSYSIPAATHKRGTRPRVHTYVNGEETYDSPKIDWSTGDVTIYSKVQVALKVLIY